MPKARRSPLSVPALGRRGAPRLTATISLLPNFRAISASGDIYIFDHFSECLWESLPWLDEKSIDPVFAP